MTSNFKPSISPTSKIELYKKTPDSSAETTQNIAQAGIADSTESIKRYLQQLYTKFPPASPGSVLFENYKYETPGVVVNLKHNMGRPYRGMDVIAVKCGVPFSLSLYQPSNQTITAGTTATMNLFAAVDPYDSYNSLSDTFTMPFSAYCTLSAAVLRAYSSGTITLTTDVFYLYNATDGFQYSQSGIFSAVSTTSTNILRYATFTQQNLLLESGKAYSMRFVANSMTQTISGVGLVDATEIQLFEPSNPTPRIDGTLDASWSDAVKSVYVPVVCDRACTFTVVVW